MRASRLTTSILAVAVGVTFPLAGAVGQTLTGSQAFTSWEQSAPGTRYHITPDDLPAPFASDSASNAPAVVAMPANVALHVPQGFRVEQIASGLEGPRAIRTAPNGDIFIASSDPGEIRVLHLGGGPAREPAVFADNLNQPYGIAFYPPGPDPEWVYVANTDSVVRFPYRNGDVKASAAPETVVSGIPTGYHWTRDIAFSPDGSRLFVSVGSGSNIAEDVADPSEGIDAFASTHPAGLMWGDEQYRADVLAFDPNTLNQTPGDANVYATGLRNCSGLTVQPATGDLWCVVNERDGLGDNLAPDYATRVAEGGFYGWPWYYIGNHEDPRAPLKGQRPDLADKVTVPDVLIQPHSAPLTVAFYEGDMFPADYKGDAFVALHGSWNRGDRTGYKVVRLIMDDSGKPTGEYEDFLTGFVADAGDVWGRPVGVTVAADGSLIVSEDGNGTIWRVTHDRKES